MSSQFTYGPKTFDESVVNVRRHDIKRRFSPRRKVLSQIETLFLELHFNGSGQNLIDQINEAGAAFRQDYNDAIFTVDGIETPHSLRNSESCISGVKVVGSSFPKGDRAELATRRTHTVILQAEYDTAETQLVYWKERIEYIGDGGPKAIVEETFFGPIDVPALALATSVRVIQSGRAIGFRSYVLEPIAAFPSRLHRDQSRVAYESGDNQGLAVCFNVTEWTYFMTLLGPAFVAPQGR